MISSLIPKNRSNAFYRTTYSSLMLSLIALIVTIIVMVIIVLYQVLHRPLPLFHVIATNKKTMELTAFDEPNYLPETLIRWSKKAAVAAYTFDFVNYGAQLKNVAPFFTESGWSDYSAQANELISAISQRKLFVNGVVTGAPVISNQGELGDRGYVWRIQLPFLVTYQSSETVSQKSYFVFLTIVKVPTNIDPTGIGIDQFVMK